MGMDLFEDFTYIKRADILAQSDYHREDKLKNLEILEEYYKEVVEQEQCVTVRDLAVSGKDLIEIGMKPGPELGEMLKILLDKVLDDPELNEKDVLIGLAKARISIF